MHLQYPTVDLPIACRRLSGAVSPSSPQRDGAILGFAPFNKPAARLFLGNEGSPPIGLLLAWLLIDVAGRGHLVAALVLPLYYLADATITLFRRIAGGETFWKAHRARYYQRATDNGFTVPEIVAHVFPVNLALAVLALISVLVPTLSSIWPRWRPQPSSSFGYSRPLHASGAAGSPFSSE